MRVKEFETYLLKHNRNSKGTKQCIGLCKRIEKIMGKSIDELVSSKEKMDKTMEELKKAGSFRNLRFALNSYYDFASSTMLNGWVPMFPISKPTTTVNVDWDPEDLVIYENTVPNGVRISGLRDFLKEEYEKIRKFACDILVNLPQDLPTIPVYLSEKRPTKSYYYDRQFLLSEMGKYCRECKRVHCEPPYCGVSEVLGRYEPFTDDITGEFYREDEPHIVIYFRNFSNPSMSDQEFLADISKTLAHEYMHYLHYAYAGDQYNHTTKELKEALADFFGVLYLIYREGKDDLIIAQNRYNRWKEKFGSCWAYANALYFYYVNGQEVKFSLVYSNYYNKGCIDKFIQVFRCTGTPDQAYNTMIK